jgi:hypothetical protein
MSDLIYAAIIACELGFWVVLFTGLSTRYILDEQRLSMVLLVGVPLVDLLLLAFTVIDLHRGGDRNHRPRASGDLHRSFCRVRSSSDPLG